MKKNHWILGMCIAFMALLPGIPAGAEGEAPEVKKALGETAFLGVETSRVSGALRAHLDVPEGVGLVVGYVVEGSGADEAGLRRHDILVKFGDQLLVNSSQLAVLVRSNQPGDVVPLTFIRGGEEATVDVTLRGRKVRTSRRIEVIEPPVPPVAPVPPMPFEGGDWDEQYEEAMEAYEDRMEVYEEKMEAFGERMEEFAERMGELGASHRGNWESMVEEIQRSLSEDKMRLMEEQEALRAEAMEMKDEAKRKALERLRTQLHYIEGALGDDSTHVIVEKHGETGRHTVVNMQSNNFVYSGREGTITVRQRGDGQHVVALDAEGEILFNGSMPEGGPQALPERVYRMYEKLGAGRDSLNFEDVEDVEINFEYSAESESGTEE